MSLGPDSEKVELDVTIYEFESFFLLYIAYFIHMQKYKCIC